MSGPAEGEAWVSEGPEDTRRLAEDLLRRHGAGTVFALHGDLGSGKTCFVQGLARALGIREPVGSPTFTLVNEYEGNPALTHIDLYRLAGPGDVLDLGWDEYVEAGGILAVEWAGRARGLFPPGTVHIEFRTGEPEDRRYIRVHTEGGPS